MTPCREFCDRQIEIITDKTSFYRIKQFTKKEIKSEVKKARYILLKDN